ncbi:YjiG family protein [Sulfurospirillum barnesii]|uniref:Putative membrane protein n=1 Tax=Sulfurospirillum barnesii (strain ATCC 700032 / DSM 10660 / SES-3) TaxID=760154 RepID=I3Y031_SULBS|nr:YjiG family protein [Sulfurospirillum barnesii]AFL69555.1 putative membrane protein [Sulfurospirillum barnesii SES-3]
MSNHTTPTSNNPFDIFVIGARKGFNIAINNLMPNVLMAYVIVEILNVTGAMKAIGSIFAPAMGLFGLPGEAITVLLTTWLSCSAGVGIALSLFTKEILTGTHLSILMPALFLMASQIQYMGRLLGVADVPKKYWPLLMVVSIVNACVAMLIMRFFV